MSEHTGIEQPPGRRAGDAVEAIERFSLMLWRERELMSELVYRFDVEHLVLTAGHVEHLANASRDVEHVLARIREVEALRMVACSEVTSLLGLPADASLQDIAAASPLPWNDILREHRATFLDITQRILSLASANRDSIASGQRAIRDTLLGLGEEPVDYTNGTTGQAGGTAVLFDQSM